MNFADVFETKAFYFSLWKYSLCDKILNYFFKYVEVKELQKWVADKKERICFIGEG